MAKRRLFGKHNIEITEKTDREYEQFKKWYDKAKARGDELSDLAGEMYKSEITFAKRKDDIIRANKEIGRSNDNYMSQIKDRAFEGGSYKQVVAMKRSVEQNLNKLQKENPALYEQWDKELHFSTVFKIDDYDLAKLDRQGAINWGDGRTAHLMNIHDRRKLTSANAGYLDILFMRLQNYYGAQFAFRFDS